MPAVPPPEEVSHDDQTFRLILRHRFRGAGGRARVGGKTLKISTDGGVKVGRATGLSNVVTTDIATKNGVIHVIDAVILP